MVDRYDGSERHFDFEDGVAVGTSAITIVLTRGTPNPATLSHLSFHLPSMSSLREALSDLRKRGATLEDPGDEIGPEAPGSPNLGLWFIDLDGYRWERSVQNGAAESDSSVKPMNALSL